MILEGLIYIGTAAAIIFALRLFRTGHKPDLMELAGFMPAALWCGLLAYVAAVIVFRMIGLWDHVPSIIPILIGVSVALYFGFREATNDFSPPRSDAEGN